MNKLFCIILVLLLYCCSTNNKESISSINTECIDEYQFCDSVYHFDSTFTDVSGNLLYARWQIRKDNHKEAISILDSLKRLMSDRQSEKLYQDIVLHLFIAKANLFELDIESIESQLELDLDPIHNINMLYFLAKVLRAKQEVNYSFATSLYAENLRSKLPINLSRKIHYLPWAIHSINLIRENADTSICKYYLQKSIKEIESETPGSRWMKTLLLTQSNNLSEQKIQSIRETVANKKQYSPTTDQIINTHLNYVAADDHYAIKKNKEDIDPSEPPCAYYKFYNTTYLIDAYIATGNLKKAESYLDSVLLCSELGIRFYNMALLRKQTLLYHQYMKSKDNDKLIELYNCSKELIHSYAIQGKSIVNEHYADAIYKSNSIFLESLYELNRSDKTLKIDILNHVNDIKYLYNKISDSRSVLGNKIAGLDIQKINELKYEIEKREVSVNRYLDTIHTDINIYKDLYNLHKELYDLKSKLPIVEDLSSYDFHKIKLSDVDKNTQIIDYIQTDSSHFLTIITSDKIEIKKLDSDQISKAITQKKYLLKNKDNPTQRNYLDEIISQIISKDHKNIIFVPDGNLFDFPIEVITDDTGKYLIEDYTISYASQISEAINQKPEILQNKVLAVSYTSDATINDRTVRSFPELSYGQSEVDQIANIYSDVKTYSGYQLTEQNLSQELNQDIVHISSHSKSSPDNPLDNYILIRDTKGKGIPIYGFALKAMDWDTKLVVLSSCESGTGTIKSGAGIFSLSRDFLQAGAWTVIKSLWKVNEKSTSELMILFHKNFRNGLPVAEALRQAKISLKSQSEYAHPYYWAGFILEGNPNLKFSDE